MNIKNTLEEANNINCTLIVEAVLKTLAGVPYSSIEPNLKL